MKNKDKPIQEVINKASCLECKKQSTYTGCLCEHVCPYCNNRTFKLK